MLTAIINGNMDTLVAIFIMLSGSIYLRVLLQVVGQTWVKTIAHTATLMLLPLLTYIITSVISGNIALSLGMVGALSIVRFRNPVRSPLELSVYFGAITMGISAAVSLKWLILLLGSVTLVAIVLVAIQIFTQRLLGQSFFISSFSEGNNMSTLIITSSEKIQEIDESKYLMGKISNQDQITYSLACPNFSALQEIEKRQINDSNIKNIQLSR